jgi:predicted PurR-regulated permease PerM
LAVGALLFFGREVFIPVALALLFSMILSSPVEGLRRWGVPRTLAAFIVLGAITIGLAIAVELLIEPAQAWFDAAPHTLRVIEKKIRPVETLIHRVQSLTQRAGHVAGPPAPEQPASPAEAPVTAAAVMSATGSTLASVMTMILLTLFLLSGGPPLLARMTASLAASLHASHALNIIEAIRTELGHYYITIALINLGLGVATALVMELLGMPNPFLWGAAAAVLNFIPYVGSATTLVLLAIVALVAFDNLGRVMAVLGSYLALTTLEGQVVQPLLVGRRLALNPIVVFLAVWFGGWAWGVAGIVIAVPTLVALKVAASHAKNSTMVVEFLSPVGSETLESIRGRIRVESRRAVGNTAAAESRISR